MLLRCASLESLESFEFLGNSDCHLQLDSMN